MLQHFLVRRLGALSLGLLALVAAGCGDEKPTGTVAGKVSVDGAPVQGATIVLLDKSTGAGGSAKVDGGQFRFPSPLRTGTYSVALQAPPAPPPLEMKGNAAPPSLDVPKKLQSPETSGQTITIGEGQNESLTIDFKTK